MLQIWTIVLKPRNIPDCIIRLAFSGILSLNEEGAKMQVWMLIGDNMERCYVIDSVTSSPYGVNT